eukprot:4051613-Pyramimonas_sp.AAC.1
MDALPEDVKAKVHHRQSHPGPDWDTVQSDRGIRSRSVRRCPSALRVCWMYLCILGSVPSDVLFVLADGRSHVLQGCYYGLGPTVR